MDIYKVGLDIGSTTAKIIVLDKSERNVLFKNRKTFCNPPIKRNVDFLQALTQNEMRFFI